MEPERNCLGIDVSKAKLDGVVERAQTPIHKQQRHKLVANSKEGTKELCTWAAATAGCELKELRVLFEATSSYHIIPATAAHSMGCQVFVVNPRRAHQYGRAIGKLTKNDKVDAAMLASFGLHVPSHRWAPPPPEINELYALLSRRYVLEDSIRRDESRQELIETRDVPPAVQASLEESIRFNIEASERLSRAIDELFERNVRLNHDRQLLLSIPSIGADAANYLLCLLRGRMFESAREAAALCGVTPVHRHSGTDTMRKGRISKESNKLFRVILQMPAMNAIAYNPQMKEIYGRLKANGKQHKQAVIAVIRHFVHTAYGVLKHQKPYDANWAKKTPEERAAAPTVFAKKRLRRKNDIRLSKLRMISGQATPGPLADPSTFRTAPSPGEKSTKRKWTAEDLSFLHEQVGKQSLQSISATLGRTPVAVQLKLSSQRLADRARKLREA